MKKQTQWFFVGLLAVLLLSSFISALPAGPSITYVSNSTATPISTSRSQDVKGTITVVTMSAKQQDYKWKAYVGNVTGHLALDDANAKSIYDWALSTITGEVYASRTSSINWANITCANTTVVTNEEAALGLAISIPDNINNTFSYLNHTSFLVGTKNITQDSCKSTATYVNSTAQVVNDTANFQEILLQDGATGSLVYSTLINNDQLGYDGVNTYDFQMIIAENESATIPTTYYFYVELG